MDQILIAPGKYVQGEHTINRLGDYVKPLGQNAAVIADAFVTGLVGDAVTQSCAEAGINQRMELFGGECSRPEIERLMKIFAAQGSDVIVGIGGGKTLDTAKAIGFYHKIPTVIVPTIASTDAPTSALTVIYTPEGEFSEYLLFPSNPNLVVMDTAIIAKAPVRLLVAGIGDALSTYFEARANGLSGKATMAGGLPTKAGQALAKLCYETLLADGYKAKVAAENGVSSTALKNIIEANTLLSGLGFESSGLAAAHAIHNGLTKLEDCHHLYHGEKVAFGTLTQLLLENAPMEEIEAVIGLCRSVGLPTNLFEMGVEQLDMDKLREVAEASCAEGETIHNMPFPVTPDMVLAAMLTAHQIGLAAD